MSLSVDLLLEMHSSSRSFNISADFHRKLSGNTRCCFVIMINDAHAVWEHDVKRNISCCRQGIHTRTLCVKVHNVLRPYHSWTNSFLFIPGLLSDRVGFLTACSPIWDCDDSGQSHNRVQLLLSTCCKTVWRKWSRTSVYCWPVC